MVVEAIIQYSFANPLLRGVYVLDPGACQILEKETCLLLGEAIERNASLLYDR